jgi:hypothetical protein
MAGKGLRSGQRWAGRSWCQTSTEGAGWASVRPDPPLAERPDRTSARFLAFYARRAAAQSARGWVDFRGSPPLGNHLTNAAVCQSVRRPGRSDVPWVIDTVVPCGFRTTST